MLQRAAGIRTSMIRWGAGRNARTAKSADARRLHEGEQGADWEGTEASEAQASEADFDDEDAELSEEAGDFLATQARGPGRRLATAKLTPEQRAARKSRVYLRGCWAMARLMHLAAGYLTISKAAVPVAA